MIWINFNYILIAYFQLIVILTKYDPVSLASSSPSLSNDDGHGNNVIILEEDKKLSRNYASYECGAKVITSNPEAQHTSHILKESKDEYMLNPCKVKKWFVVELCEPIQPSAIELANFELFSSTPKELFVQGSERFPTNTWINLGTFAGNDTRELQRFEIKPQTEFIKFIKIDITDHYGSEHFCPFSLIRVFGVSLVEDFDAIENGQVSQVMTNPVVSPIINPVVVDVNGQTKEETSTTSNENVGKDPSNLTIDTGNNVKSSDVFDQKGDQPQAVKRESVLQMVRNMFPQSNDDSRNQAPISEPETQISTPFTDVLISDVDKFEGDLKHYLKITQVLPKIEHYVRVSKCLRSTKSSNSKSTIRHKLCNYIKIMVTSEIYEKIIQEIRRNISTNKSIVFTCDAIPINTTLTNDDNSSKKEEVVSEEPKDNTSNIIKDQIKPIFDTIYQALVTPSTISSVLIETSTPTVPIPPPIDILPFQSAAGADNKTVNNGAESVNLPTEPLNVSSSDVNPTPTVPITETVTVADSSSPAIDTPSSTVTTPSTAQSTMAASVVAASSSKESIFIKINNRIKAIEQNLSISSGLLDDLLIRHREQMIEIQKAFNQTHETFTDIKNASQVENEQLKERISSLEAQVLISSEQINLLVAEKELFHWQLIFWHILLILTELILIVIAANIFIRRISRIAMAVTSIEELRLQSAGDNSTDASFKDSKKTGGDSEDDSDVDNDKCIQYKDIQGCDVSTSSSMFDTASFDGDPNPDVKNNHLLDGSSNDWSSNQLIVDSDKENSDRHKNGSEG